MTGTSGLTTIVDAHPRFWCEFVLWTLCANRFVDQPKRAYFIGEAPEGLVSFAREEGIDVRFSEVLMPRSPHCNKLIPFLDETGFDHQIVTDTDVFILGDLFALFDPGRVRLAPNNHCNPPLSNFRTIFRQAGLDAIPEPGITLYPGLDGLRETYAGNVSAGVICIPRQFREFVPEWLKRAEWVADHIELLGRFKIHIDQVSFAVAAKEFDLPFSFLPPQANAVLELLPQIDTLIAAHLTSGHICHYPDWFEPDGTLKVNQINPRLEAPLGALNELISEAMIRIEAIGDLAPHKPMLMNPSYRR